MMGIISWLRNDEKIHSLQEQIFALERRLRRLELHSNIRIGKIKMDYGFFSGHTDSRPSVPICQVVEMLLDHNGLELKREEKMETIKLIKSKGVKK